MIKNLLFLAIVTLVSGCGAGSGSSQDESKFTINGEPAKAFYSRFEFKAEGDCNDVSTVHFRYLSSVAQTEVGRDVNGDPIVGRVELALQRDGSYTGTYIESIYVHSGGGIAHLQEISRNEISGRWSVNGLNLNVDHVGQGTGGEFNAEPVVYMNVRGVALNRALDGQSIMLGAAYSNLSPQGETAADYCARVSGP